MPSETVYILRLEGSKSGLLQASYSYEGDFSVENFSEALKKELQINAEDEICSCDILGDCTLSLDRPPKSISVMKKTGTDMLKWYIGYEKKFLELIANEYTELCDCVAGNSKNTEQLYDDAIENASRKYLIDHLPKHFTVVDKAGWILKREGSSDQGTREHDILITHGDTAFNYPPLGSPGPFKNDVKAKFNMVPESSILLHIEVKSSLKQVKDASNQLKSSGTKGSSPVIKIESSDSKFFRRDRILKIFVTGLHLKGQNGNRNELDKKVQNILVKLLTQDWKQVDGIAVIGWGFFIRTDSCFVPVYGPGMALFFLDRAITERQSSFTTTDILSYM